MTFSATLSIQRLMPAVTVAQHAKALDIGAIEITGCFFLVSESARENLSHG